MNRKTVHTFIYALGLLTILAICLVYLVFGNSDIICFSTLFPSLASVEHNAYLKFPPSVRSIEYDAKGVNRKAGCTIWVKFEMNSAELNSFLTTTYVKQLSASAPSTWSTPHFFDAKGWIQPVNSLSGHGIPKENQGETYVQADQWIVVDTTNPATYVIYLVTNKEWL